VKAVALEYQLSKLFTALLWKTNLLRFNTKLKKTCDSCFFCTCKLQMITNATFT